MSRVQVETREHFVELFARVGVAHEIAVGDDASLQQIAVARQQDAVLVRRDSRELVVVVVVAVQGVETELAQVAREPAEVAVEHEARLAQWCIRAVSTMAGYRGFRIPGIR